MQEENNTKYIRELLAKYHAGTCSPREVRELFEIFKHPEADQLLAEDLQREFDISFPAEENRNVSGKLFSIKSLKKFAIPAAAALVILLGLSYYLFTNEHPENGKVPLAKQESIVPGHNQAILTMDNGQRINLDSAGIGQLAVASGTVISLDKKGELLFASDENETRSEISLNTLSTPVGGMFKVVLPDGSNVWLNAESELTFPSRFSGRERNVSLKGEGYFEVAKNKAMPFKVRLEQGEEITVLGTAFNVMSYSDESNRRITLLEGSIGLAQGGVGNVLKPGQQAVISEGKVRVINNIDTDHEIAWKNGLFDFQHDDLPAIMRQLSRWYNVETVDNAFSPDGHYTGKRP